MRVVYVHPFTQQLSGPDESLLALLGPLLSSGVEAHLVVPRLGPLAERYRALGVVVHVHPLTILRRGMRLTEAAAFGPRVLARGASLAVLLRRISADLVHTNMEAVLEGGLAARLAGIPHVLHYRGNSLDSPRLLFDVLTLTWTGFADHVFCISKATAEIFRRRGRDAKIEVLYNPLRVSAFRAALRSDTVRAALGAGQGQPLVITMGRIHPRKDIETFIRACALVAEQLPEARFAVVGSAESPAEVTYQTRVEALIRETGLQQRMTLAGARTDVPDVMKAADLFVLASRHEGFGRVLAEAMAAGTAVVASREGALPELIEEPRFGLGAPAGDHVAFSRQILDLLRDGNRRGQMGAAAAERAIGFDAHHIADRVLRCYEDLVSRRRPQRRQ